MSRYTNEEQKIDSEDRKEMEAAIAHLLDNPSFRVFMRRFLGDVGAFENSGLGPNVYSSNALATAHESGKLATVHTLVNYLSAVNRDFYSQILKEYEYVRLARERRLADLADSGRGDSDPD